MIISALSIFPQIIKYYCDYGIVKQAINKGALKVDVFNLRDFAIKGQVDDTVYGGLPGMVLKPEPIFEAYSHIEQKYGKPYVICPEPWGKRLDQKDFERWKQRKHILVICGRYEGIDERVKVLVDEEVSLGDFVLSGGEVAALAIIDGISRLLPDVLSEPESLKADSFFRWLGYPVYTKPREFKGMQVPDILVSGDHRKIKLWALWHSIERTLRKRPDLVPKDLTDLEIKIIQAIKEGVKFEDWIKKHLREVER